MVENSLNYCLCRDVREPRRATENEAGIDFFIPSDLSLSEMNKLNPYGVMFQVREVNNDIFENPKIVTGITILPHCKVIIPSGVRVLITPPNSMLMAANKSGISTKKGLIYGAEIVDSTYTGEIHLSLINTTSGRISLDFDKAILQFIHVPVYLTVPQRIPVKTYDEISKYWSKRGSNWQGSTDNN